MISVRKILEEIGKICTSAPCRIDAGGTWDIKAIALPFEGIFPTTVNMAIDLRTYVYVLPFDEGYIKIVSRGFEPEIIPYSELNFTSPYGIFIAAVRYFGFHGLEIQIDSKAPVKSGLGGSSTALVAVIKALSEIKKYIDGKDTTKEQILYLAYHIEDGISGGGCGAQDQGAAVYGGVNQWIWKYSKPTICDRIPLLSQDNIKKLSNNIVVLYSGKSHISSEINQKWIREFLSGKTQKGWIKVNQVVREFADAISKMELKKAVEYLKEEVSIRKKITPDAFTPFTEKLIEQAQDIGCGARFTGAGAGGSVWAIGEKKDIQKLKSVWQKSIDKIPEALLLECKIDYEGVKLHSNS